MDATSAHMKRYLYEYFFQQAVESAKAQQGGPIMVSAARRMRAQLDANLAAAGTDMDTAKVRPMLEAIDQTLTANIPGHRPVFTDAGTADPAYQRMTGQFRRFIGSDPSGSQDGPVLPISPYDPRWAGRSTVKSQGSALTFVADEDVANLAGGDIGRVHTLRRPGMVLRTFNDQGRMRDAGPAVAADDRTRLSELMGYMSPQEYAEVRDWVTEGIRNPDGTVNEARAMSADAASRATAVLADLQERGVPYTVGRDLNPGQIAARVKGTKLSVRLMDTAENEAYVGRVWDDGVAIHYTTNMTLSPDGPRGKTTAVPYTPNAQETVNLVRLAQGLPVERTDGKGEVGRIGTYQGRSGGKTVTSQDSYHVKGRGQSAVVGDLRMHGGVADPNGTVVPGRKVLVTRNTRDRSATSTWVGTPEAAEARLREYVDSARANLVGALDVDRLLAEHADNVEAAASGEYVPAFSGDTEVASIQRAYWDVMRGAQDTLLRPGATREEYEDATAFLAEVDDETGTRDVLHDEAVSHIAYTGTPEQKVRAHLEQAPDGMIGTYDLTERTEVDGTISFSRFDPARVAKYMDSEHSELRRTSEIVSALRRADIDPQQLRGESFAVRAVKDRLVKFDPESARSIEDLPEGSMVRRMAELTRDTLERTAIKVEDVRADKHGIIAWNGGRIDSAGKSTPVAGQVGQVFEMGEHGELVTDFASGQNHMLVPGYEGRISAQKPGETKTVEERMLLRGYEQQMTEAVRYRVTQDALVTWSEVGEPSSLNGVYRRLYDERLPVDFLERADERGLGVGRAEAVLQTLAGRVRLSDAMGDTFYQAWRAERGVNGTDPSNDNHFDPLVLSGGRNMAVIPDSARGYFDPDMTNASNMGTTFYLAEGAQVDLQTGRMSPSANPEDRAPLMKLPELSNMAFNSWDRRQMISSMLLHATGVTEPEGVVMTDQLKGWTADDGRIVSKEYAQRNQMMTKDGSMRPLVVGDKDSDLHGNKGVINLIVDPEMDLAEAREQGIEDEVKMFRDNPGLSVVMSPFSGISRFNGGTAREMMQDVRDVTMPDGTVVPGGMGSMRFVITNKDVEAGTRHYGEDAVAQGKGRRASAQQAWGLGAVGADAVMGEFYGNNATAATNMREYLVTMGMDMSPTGELSERQLPETALQRELMTMPPLELTRATDKRPALINGRAMRAAFAAQISDRGGDMELPFPLKFPTGARLPQTEQGTWRMPVLSAHLRAGQEMTDGTSTAHDYTNQYLSVFEKSCAYRYAQDQLETADLTDKRRRDLQDQLASLPREAQGAFDSVTKDIENRRLSGRHNLVKEQVMSARLPNSATAVWTADPRLAINEVGMGMDLAEALGVEDGESVMLWRDPVLRDGGIRYMEVKVDPRLAGVSINPVMDKSFDGDFDGDSVGVAALHGDRARAQAYEKLSVEANLLDTGSKTTIELDGDEIEVYPLYMQDSLDTKVSQHFHPELKDRFDRLTLRANEVHADHEAGDLGAHEYMSANRELVKELSGYYHDALDSKRQGVSLRFDSAASHMESMKQACVDTGAKGNEKKLAAYGRHFGMDEAGVDHAVPLHTRTEDEGVMVAVTVKTAVGIAGTYSQRGVKALRSEQLKPVLELTYPVTQSLLQAKHDPHEAMDKYTMLMGPGRALWRGRLMEPVTGPDGQPSWEAAKDKRGAEIQASPEQWAKQFVDMYESKNGLNVKVNPDYVEAVAKSLSEDGKMLDMEAPDFATKGKATTMDRLAYGGGFADWQAAASRKENVYAGAKNADFAPYAVRNNVRALEDHEVAMERRADPTRDVPAAELEALVARDVRVRDDERFRERGASRRSDRAVSVRAARPRPVIEDEADFPAEVDEGYSL